MSKAKTPPLPPTPFPFIAQPETYRMAVRYYLNDMTARAIAAAKAANPEAKRPSVKDIIGVLRNDSLALDALHKRGEL